MDVNNYWENIDNWYSRHLIPYRDYSFEYPPVALIFFLVPRLFSWNLESFHIAYGLCATGAFFIGLYYTFKIADYFGASHKLVAISAIATILSMHLFIISRYDIFPAVLIIISLSKYLERKYATAFFIISIAAMLKLYPALAIAVYLLPFILKSEWVQVIKSISICIVVFIVCELPFLLLDSSSAFSYLSYHSARGIQVESVIASFIELYHYFDQTCCSVIENYGSENLWGPLPDLIVPYVAPAMILAFVVFILWLVFELKHVSINQNRVDRIIPLSVAVMILIFVVFNKVYSAQYGIWIMLALMLCFDNKIKHHKNNLVIFVLLTLSACSFVAAEYFWMTGPELDTLFPIFEAVKNLATVLSLAALVYCIHNEVCGYANLSDI